jgi:hypothetical protein
MTVDAALADLRAMLQADGFELQWEQQADAVEVRIAAGPEACDECLVPRPMLETMIGDALSSAGARLGALVLPDSD